MAPKSRKAKSIGQNLSDEFTLALTNSNHSLPVTKQVLQTKPHFTPGKHDDIPAAVKELKDLSLTLSNCLLQESNKEKQETEKNNLLLCALCNFVKSVLHFEEFFDLVHIGRIVNHLSFLLTCDNISAKVKNQISILCERYVEVSIIDEHVKVSQCLINYLLDLTLCPETVKKIDIKRVWSLQNFIDVMNAEDPGWEIIVRKYISTVTNSSYLTYREGQHVIGHLMRKNISYVKKIHDIIIHEIPKLPKQLCVGYGQAYFVAWSFAELETQKVVEECIQDIMLKVLNIPRAGVEMPKAGMNAFAVLSNLHSCRKLRNFSHTLNTLYSPLLWRLLRDDDPWKRCNAAAVFFDVFPLETPYSTVADNAFYLERQINEMKDLLMDGSHFVRIIAIRGICTNMVRSLELFNIGDVKRFMEILALELTTDGSTYLVRKAVFEGFESMLCDSSDDGAPNNSALVLEKVLPSLQKSIYDENEKVRKAYVKMWLKVKEKAQFVTIRYWDVNSLEDIVAQMAYEGPTVGKLLSKLTIEQVISKRSPPNKIDQLIGRFCKMIDWSFQGLKNIFIYSEHCLPVEDAYRLIVTFIGTIRKYLKEYLESLNSSNDSTIIYKAGKKNKINKLKEIKENDVISDDESSAAFESGKDKDSTISSVASSVRAGCKTVEQEFLEKHKHICGLIQISSIIWVVFRKELSENEEYITNLYNLAAVSVPMFLKHYKGTSVYYATVTFASLIPIAKLRPVSTISSACISELKEITESTDSTKLECLISALCSWSRGHDVLELASEWLNFAFREQNLNNTALNKAPGQKVRFLQNSGKPLLALRLLDVLFSDLVNEERIIKKNCDQLFDFYTCLERILIIIERKLSNPEEFNKPGSTLTDEFMERALYRYLHLMHTLHRMKSEKEGNSYFDATSAILKALCWGADVLCPKIPLQEGNETPAPFVVECCRVVLREVTLGVALGESNDELCRGLCLFTNDLLSIESTWFLEDAFNTIKVVGEYAEISSSDEWSLLSQVLPSLHEKALSVICKIDVEMSALKNIIEDMQKFKSAIFSLPTILIHRHGAHSQQFIDVFRNLVHTCIVLLLQEINDEENVVKHSKLDSLPCFAAIILKTILVKPLFAKFLIPTLISFMKKFVMNEESLLLLSCLSILFSVIMSAKTRFRSSELESAIQTVFDIFSSYEVKEKPAPDDSFSGDYAFQIDIKKAALPVILELGTSLNCAIYRANPSEQEKIASPSLFLPKTTCPDTPQSCSSERDAERATQNPCKANTIDPVSNSMHDKENSPANSLTSQSSVQSELSPQCCESPEGKAKRSKKKKKKKTKEKLKFPPT